MRRFHLREITNNDHEWLVELHNDPLVLKNLTNPTPVSMQDHMNWWKTIDGKRQIRLIFCVDKKRVGICKFYSIDRSNSNCVLGADIHKEHRGKGLAKPMWRLMMDYCYEELELSRISLTTAEYNMIARKVYLGLGFKEEGRMISSLFRDEKWYDQICMYHLKEWCKKNV